MFVVDGDGMLMDVRLLMGVGVLMDVRCLLGWGIDGYEVCYWMLMGMGCR